MQGILILLIRGNIIGKSIEVNGFSMDQVAESITNCILDSSDQTKNVTEAVTKVAETLKASGVSEGDAVALGKGWAEAAEGTGKGVSTAATGIGEGIASPLKALMIPFIVIALVIGVAFIFFIKSDAGTAVGQGVAGKLDPMGAYAHQPQGGPPPVYQPQNGPPPVYQPQNGPPPPVYQ